MENPRGLAEFHAHCFFPHNEGMRLREAVNLAAYSVFLCLCLLVLPLAAKAPAGNVDPGYIPALAAADHLLQAWQSGDVENGTVLLSSHVKEAATAETVEKFFSTSAPSAYEVGRGKLLKRGRYEFPVVLMSSAGKDVRTRRLRFSSVIVVKTGNNEWAVGKLP
jgi:hypothetical protein